MNETQTFELPIPEFDLSLLPPHCRDTSSEAFRDALTEFVRRELSGSAKWMEVVVDQRVIRVSWRGTVEPEDALQSALARLKSGDVPRGIQSLRLLLRMRPNDELVHYNLGMALSDTSQLHAAVRHLREALRLAPGMTNAKVALAVALMRSREPNEAERLLTEAVAEEPDNPYALRNLGGCLFALDKDLPRAEQSLRKATQLTGNDQQAWFGLAQVCEKLGKLDDADSAYLRVLDINFHNDIAEMAKRGRSRLTQQAMRANVGGGLRMDAVMYCLSAMQQFDAMMPEQVKQAAFEIATVGTRGLDPNDPAKKYTLRCLTGSFSALQLLSYMFVAFKRISPETDMGFDLAREYEAATQMHQRGQKE
jgi:tetratricopeptide (TPR) repeat protein